ncbi:MAG: acyl-CoA dehydrogenase family protein [Desulfatiglans sp.]|jgi:acyl-CoA dehydrogenase|nr:acyl-CoA dehydrogenase family protein [Thermodesulfobacteriota bacterium]MEE4352844.1 acyl-CoA dehydrogenase family protein [Desulfatiglans sp.]
MDFELTSENLMLKESAASFVKKDHSFERLRELKNDQWGYSKDVWQKMAELGWMGLTYPEEYGGLELDFSYVLVLQEEFGKGVLPEPWLSTVLLSGGLVLSGGTESQKEQILPEIVSGDLMMSLAYLEEDGLFEINHCSTAATKKEGDFSISGKKVFVMDGCSADKFIVTARTSGSLSDSGGITLFLVPKEADGMRVTPLKTIDGRNACILEFNDVTVPAESIIGEPDSGFQILSNSINKATAGVCAEMIGGMQACLDLTVEYISERMQFNKPIGSFQALQHKAADMFIQKELATSATYYAIASVVEGVEDQDMGLAVSVAKAKCSSSYMDITKTAIQLFGAIGFTSEADVGFFLKRALATKVLFGDVDYHLNRYSVLKGD